MKLKKICIFTFITVFALSTFTFAESVNSLQNKSSVFKSQISKAQQGLNVTNTQKQNVQTEVEKLDQELAKVQAEIQQLDLQLRETTARLKKSEEELVEAIKIKEEQYETLKKRIKVMYEYSDSGFIDILLSSQNFGDLLNRVEYTNRLMDYDNELLDKYEKSERIINENVQIIAADKKSIETIKSEREDKQKLLDKKIVEKNAVVKQLDANAASYQAQIADLQQQDANVQQLIQQAQAKAAEAAKARTLTTSKQISRSSGGTTRGSSGNTVYNSDGKKFQYPVPSYNGYKPNSGYGYRGSPISGKQEFHTGLDLKATLNTDVVASDSGTVIYAGWRGGYGKTIIVDHGGGYSTLYAHNNVLKVSVGQQVSRGQVLAGAGTTGYSTGVHSHYEVRVNGSHTNPSGYIY